MGALPGSPADGSRAADSPAPDVEPTAPPHREVSRRRSRRSEHAHRSRAGRLLANFGIGASVAIIVAAPLAAGGVHRAAMIALMLAAFVCVASLAGGLVLQGRAFRVGVLVLLPLAFTLVPLLQSIPLPLSLRAVFDGAGTALLSDNHFAPISSWPLSLDPSGTRVYVGRGAVALVVFLVAYHLASGQTRRHLLLRAVAIAGLAAVVIGIGHRIFGVSKLYGLFNTSIRALITGPFVNANHTAELLELSAFACLACSLQRDTALNRVGWLIGTLLCAGAALATLSRGAVVALVMGLLVFAFLRYVASDGSRAGRRRVSLAWAGLILCVVVLGAGSFGASELIDRFKTSGVTTDVRFQLWRDGLRVFAAHPFGIGRGAFDRVYPIYRTLKTPTPLRFAFVENEPLQLLIDCGWLFFLVLAAAALLLVGWRIFRDGRRDKIEAALIAGLIAVLVHSTLDFGLETLGVLVPFMAILGSVFGRLKTNVQEPAWTARAGWGTAAVAAASLIFGVAATAHRSFDDFDGLLKQAQGPDARRALLVRAQQTHPLDYFYALSYARMLPLKGDPSASSPRMHALNRALRLCPGCDSVHVEVARNLWSFGRRRQALLEWRTAMDIQPLLFTNAVGELFMSGAKPEELAAIAATDIGRSLDLVAFLSSQGRLKEAFVVLDQADALGGARGEILLARAGLQLKMGQLGDANASVESAVKSGVQDSRLAILRARLLLAGKGADGADAALAILDEAAARDPSDVNLQRERVELVAGYKRWNAAARALEGLKLALFRAYGTATDAHIWAARIDGELGRRNRSLDEYRIALADRPGDVALWIEYARAAETAGRDIVAREAYTEAARLSPNSPDISSAQRALEARSIRLRSPQTDGAQPGTH